MYEHHNKVIAVLLGIILLSLYLLLNRCTYEVDTTTPKYTSSLKAATRAWGFFYPRVSEECKERLQSLQVLEMYDLGCYPRIGPHGCYAENKMQIRILKTITDKEKKIAATHEYVHDLSSCELNDGDRNHKNKKLWFSIGGEDTVEGWARTILE